MFSKENITAWCVVPFDAKQRNPQERAEMLQTFGFKNLAYDWRDVNIPEFDEEVSQLKKTWHQYDCFLVEWRFPVKRG